MEKLVSIYKIAGSNIKIGIKEETNYNRFLPAWTQTRTWNIEIHTWHSECYLNGWLLFIFTPLHKNNDMCVAGWLAGWLLFSFADSNVKMWKKFSAPFYFVMLFVVIFGIRECLQANSKNKNGKFFKNE